MPYIYFCSEVAERERIKWIYRPAPLFIIKVFCHQVECGTRGYGFYPPTFQYRNCVQRLSIFDLYLREVLPLRRLGKFNTVSSSNFCAVSGPVWGCFLKWKVLTSGGIDVFVQNPILCEFLHGEIAFCSISLFMVIPHEKQMKIYILKE